MPLRPTRRPTISKTIRSTTIRALGGLDALVLTAGIGEHSAEIRQRVCADAAWLGIAPDRSANLGNGPCISVPGSRASDWVIPTNEELMPARHAQELLVS